LLGEATQLATNRGMRVLRVLRARGLQPEARLPFAGLRQLQPVLGEIRGMLPARSGLQRSSWPSGPAPR